MERTFSRRAILAGTLGASIIPHLRAQQPGSGPTPRFGINLSSPVDWNSEQAFVDVFRLSRSWISQKEGAGWGQGPELDLDQHGWVRSLEYDCSAETLILNISGGHFPGGEYTVLYDGAGKLAFPGVRRVLSRDPGRAVIDVDSQRKGFRLRVEETDPENYIRNIRVMMPGFDDRTEEEPFRPDFLQRWGGVASLRFMDWMHTNDSVVSQWSDRPTSRDQTFSTRGVSIEAMINLANHLEADPWFCIPHLADDNYVRNFAVLVAQKLKPDLRPWVEYSNEVWNTMFDQTDYVADRGMELGFSRRPFDAGRHFTAFRSKQIFQIWDTELGAGRSVRVLPSQAVSTWVSEQTLGFRDAYRTSDVLAIAPYISCNVSGRNEDRRNRLTTNVVEKWSVDEALDYMEFTALPQTVEWMQEQKEVADRFGVELVAYEAGQHMVGILGGENNETVTRLFHAANAHPRMGDIYRKYYRAWADSGGDLMCGFNSVGAWTKWGSWGLLQYADDDPAAAPKYQASVEWARACGQPMQEV